MRYRPPGCLSAVADDDRKRAIARSLQAVRARTRMLLDPLDDHAVHTQHDPIMSPLVWDLGHVGNFEELWLLRELGHRSAVDPDLDRVYNPFDNPRWVRADLPLLRRPDAHEYLQTVRADVLRVLRATELDPDVPLLADGYVWSMVVQHEAQHQETMLQALALRPDLPPHPGHIASTTAPGYRSVDDSERVVVAAGPSTAGTDDRAHAYDNERPRHVVDLPAFTIDRFPVTARRYAAFIANGGYDGLTLWSERGRAWLAEHGHRAPQGWVPDGDGGWSVRRFGRIVPLDPREPVEHVSHFEADAFARWAGGRLPSEQEWEKAAVWDPAAQRARTYPWGEAAPTDDLANLDRRRWGPAPVGSYPAGASAFGVEQLLGDGYEWTSSSFDPYPGTATFPYPEYSEVFYGGDWKVLRGASWATASSVARGTFRNWDHPYRRQIFAGIRVAYDLRG